jgi:hypothetical protein
MSSIAKLTIFWIFFFLVLFLTLTPLAAQVMDLEKWAQAGMPESIRQKMVIQSLSHRARPPLTGEFLLEMVRYGGENLTLSYLNLDSATAQQAQAPLSPEVVSRLMSSGAPRADLEMIINAANRGAERAPEAPVVTPVGLRPVTEEIVEKLGPETVNPTSVVAPSAPQIPHAPPTVSPAPTSVDLRKVPQTLAPGVPADPSRPMPPDPSPYQIRRPQGNQGVFMGVQEVVKPDGHVYQVNSNGRRGLMGYEVLSRPSGHKVYRYHSGRTDRTSETNMEGDARDWVDSDGMDID